MLEIKKKNLTAFLRILFFMRLWHLFMFHEQYVFTTLYIFIFNQFLIHRILLKSTLKFFKKSQNFINHIAFVKLYRVLIL